MPLESPCSRRAGTYYDRSPIMRMTAPNIRPIRRAYTPSTVPGCRTPHLWCEHGNSLCDAMGPEFTLLKFDSTVDVARWRPWLATGDAAESHRYRMAEYRLSMAAGWCCRGRSACGLARSTVSAALRTRFARTGIDQVSIDA